MSKLVGELTQQQLKSVIKYIPVCGLFLYTRNYHTFRGGHVASRQARDGYEYVSIYGRSYRAHRLAWLYMTGEWPPHQIDHTDGNPGNNRWENLRLATNAQNQQNRKIASNNTSGAKGVMRIGNRFAAHITVGGKKRYLGTFGTLNEAADAYKSAAEQEFGEFARPEIGEYKPPSTKKKVLCADRWKNRNVDGMTRAYGVRRGPLD